MIPDDMEVQLASVIEDLRALTAAVDFNGTCFPYVLLVTEGFGLLVGRITGRLSRFIVLSFVVLEQ